jgi:hypothetical protein
MEKREGGSRALARFVSAANRLVDGEVPEDFREMLCELEDSLSGFAGRETREKLSAIMGVAVNNWSYLLAMKNQDLERASAFESEYEHGRKILMGFVQGHKPDYKQSA